MKKRSNLHHNRSFARHNLRWVSHPPMLHYVEALYYRQRLDKFRSRHQTQFLPCSVHILLIPRINPLALAMYHLANMRFFGWNVDYCWRDVSPNISFAIWINYSANKTTRGLLSLGIGIQFLLLGRVRLSSCESARNIELLSGGERPRSQAHITSKTWRNAFSMKTDVLNPQEITTKISTKLFALKENTFLSFCGCGGCFVGWEDEVATAAA